MSGRAEREGESFRVVLASASPRRSSLLAELGLQVAVRPAAVEEFAPDGRPAADLAIANARLKAETISREYPESLIIGADTVVALGKEILGKPVDLGDAHRMLGMLAGQTHEVVSGVCLAHRDSGRMMLFHEVTRVRFRPLSPKAIEDYLARIEPLDKAGAYAAQDGGEEIIERMEGSYSNVVGLPTERLRQGLATMARHLNWPDLSRSVQ